MTTEPMTTTKTFTGEYIEAMPKLLAEGYKPLDVEEIFQERLEGRLLDQYYDLPTSIIRDATGHKFKIRKMDPLLLNVTPTTPLVNGAIPITPAQYNKIKGKEFDSSKLPMNHSLTKKEVLAHPVWNKLCLNKTLLKEYADMVFDKLPGKNMGIYIHGEKLSLRPWALGGVGDGDGSDALGWRLLDNAVARLVGVRREEARDCAQRALA